MHVASLKAPRVKGTCWSVAVSRGRSTVTPSRRSLGAMCQVISHDNKRNHGFIESKYKIVMYDIFLFLSITVNSCWFYAFWALDFFVFSLIWFNSKQDHTSWSILMLDLFIFYITLFLAWKLNSHKFDFNDSYCCTIAHQRASRPRG